MCVKLLLQPGAGGMEEEYKQLRDRWDAGDRDREQALHLLFLAWMHWAEPDFLTDMSHDPRATDIWHDVYAHFRGEDSSDAEFLYVAGIMASVTPWALGDEEAWQTRAVRMTARSLELDRKGFRPDYLKGAATSAITSRTRLASIRLTPNSRNGWKSDVSSVRAAPPVERGFQGWRVPRVPVVDPLLQPAFGYGLVPGGGASTT